MASFIRPDAADHASGLTAITRAPRNMKRGGVRRTRRPAVRAILVDPAGYFVWHPVHSALAALDMTSILGTMLWALWHDVHCTCVPPSSLIRGSGVVSYSVGFAADSAA